MTLYTGMEIKTFPNTNTRMLKELIYNYGFRSEIHKGFVRVLDPLGSELQAADLGRLIKRKRREARITRESLSKQINTSTMAIYEWEIGRRKPRPETLEKLKEILDITEGEIECLKI